MEKSEKTINNLPNEQEDELINDPEHEEQLRAERAQRAQLKKPLALRLTELRAKKLLDNGKIQLVKRGESENNSRAVIGAQKGAAKAYASRSSLNGLLDDDQEVLDSDDEVFLDYTPADSLNAAREYFPGRLKELIYRDFLKGKLSAKELMLARYMPKVYANLPEPKAVHLRALLGSSEEGDELAFLNEGREDEDDTAEKRGSQMKIMLQVPATGNNKPQGILKNTLQSSQLRNSIQQSQVTPGRSGVEAKVRMSLLPNMVANKDAQQSQQPAGLQRVYK